MKRGFCVLALTGALVSANAMAADAPAPASAAAPAAKLDPKVDAAARASVDKGVAFLKKQQSDNGSYGNHVGLTAEAILALTTSYHHYEPEDGPFISLATDWLVKQQRPDGAISGDATPTYNTALAILALHSVSPKAFKKQIEAGQKFLAGVVLDEADKVNPKDAYYGGMSYGSLEEERPDLSNLQFGLEALRKTDYDPNADVWKKAQMFVTRCQNRSESNDQEWAGNDGGFTYRPTGNHGTFASFGSMTFAGLKSLIFSNAKKDDPRVQSAWSWIQKNYTFNEHPGRGTVTYYYYLQTAASALNAFGEPYVTDDKGRKHLWAADLIARLASLQKPDGSWVNSDGQYWEDNPLLVTSRAVIALNNALESVGANTKPGKAAAAPAPASAPKK
jgi:squalene-hopene/tetraprenyl-beta-curcumene cyclase